jgi:two-component system response regulator DevR
VGQEGRSAVLVDDQPLFLETLERHVADLGFDNVTKFTSALSASAALPDLSPDLLITAAEMPPGQGDGIALVASATSRWPDLRAIVLSVHDDWQLVDRAFAAGAKAFVLKTTSAADLTAAIRQAFHHSIYLAGQRMPPVSSEPASGSESTPGLTPREIQVLQLLAEGHSNAELARILWVTEQTVKFHLSNIYRKLEVSNRTEASRWAQVHGLLSPSQTA